MIRTQLHFNIPICPLLAATVILNSVNVYEAFLNTLSNGKCLDWSRLKAFADDKSTQQK